MLDKKYIDKFVTAKLVNIIEPRQGWVTNIFKEYGLFIIKGQSGALYVCEGNPVIVKNPPKKNY